MGIKELYDAELMRRQAFESQKHRAAMRLMSHLEGVMGELRKQVYSVQDSLLGLPVAGVNETECYKEEAAKLMLVIKEEMKQFPPCGGTDLAISETDGEVSPQLIDATNELYCQMLDDCFNLEGAE